MGQSKRQNDAGPATTESNRKGRFGHWLRVAAMFLSGGFIFPQAMTEDMDLARFDADEDAKVKKQ